MRKGFEENSMGGVRSCQLWAPSLVIRMRGIVGPWVPTAQPWLGVNIRMEMIVTSSPEVSGGTAAGGSAVGVNPDWSPPDGEGLDGGVWVGVGEGVGDVKLVGSGVQVSGRTTGSLV